MPEDPEPTLELLLKHTEANRGIRQRRCAAGDDSAKLEFAKEVCQLGGVRTQRPPQPFARKEGAGMPAWQQKHNVNRGSGGSQMFKGSGKGANKGW